MDALRELQFDGLVGPSHSYAGLSRGNVASAAHRGETSNPRVAARQGLAKMRFVRDLGVPQAVLPPHDRPSLGALRRLGFRGSDEAVLAAAAAAEGGLLLRLCSSASAMWTANAATVAPSRDTADGRVHVTPANLQHMFHRSIETPTTTRVLRTLFADRARFVVHDPLPGGGQFADEGAANHLRLETSRGAVHVFAWGRAVWDPVAGPRIYPARQTREASAAIARLHGLDPSRCLFLQQDPAGIDAGAFHTDVLAAGNGCLLMLHERAFADVEGAIAECRRLLGDELFVVRAAEKDLPVASAVSAYPFNSQVLSVPARSERPGGSDRSSGRSEAAAGRVGAEAPPEGRRAAARDAGGGGAAAGSAGAAAAPEGPGTRGDPNGPRKGAAAGPAGAGPAPEVAGGEDEAMAIVAPRDVLDDAPSRHFLERVAASGGPVRAVYYLDVRQSMHNGGGPACLRLRMPLTADEERAIAARVVLDDALFDALGAWIARHYRDRLEPRDLADPALAREGMQALDELTQLLRLGSVYDFQRSDDRA